MEYDRSSDAHPSSLTGGSHETPAMKQEYLSQQHFKYESQSQQHVTDESQAQAQAQQKGSDEGSEEGDRHTLDNDENQSTNNDSHTATEPNPNTTDRDFDSENDNTLEQGLTQQINMLSEPPPPNDTGRQHGSQNGIEDNSDQPETAQFPIPPKDWTDLYTRFETRMAEKRQEEAAIQAEIDKLQAFYSVWLATSTFQEEDRAAKRLRTRIAHVQQSETELQNKRDHHETVVKAFQSALNLLGGD